jgi:hypothetical protein
MRALVAFLFAAFALACWPAAAAESYEALLARLKGGDLSIDFQALRYAYAETPQYSPYGNGGSAHEAFKALRAGNLDGAQTEADKVLATNYVSIDAHFVLYRVYSERGDAAKAAFHEAVYKALNQSIRLSGDGKSPATAYVVISVDEEYAFLGIAGLRLKQQALVHSESEPVDAMTVTDERGNEQTIHFNVSRAFAALTRQLGGQQESPGQ